MINAEEKATRILPRSAARAVILVMALALMPAAVFAHAAMIRSAPKANSKSQQSPKLVELWFNEELEPNLNTIEVKDGRGQRVDKGAVILSEGAKKVQVELNDLAAGAYTVDWKAVSTDEHTVHGKFTFTIEAPEGGAAVAATTPTPATAAGTQGVATPTQPAATPESSAPQAGGGTDDISWTQTVVRWLSYMAMMMIFGGFAFRLLVLAPALRHATAGSTEGADAGAASERRALTLSWASVILLALTTLVALVMQASAMYDKTFGEALSPVLLGRVITETGYGGSWVLQAVSVVALAIILFMLGGRIKRSPSGEHAALWWAGLVAAAVLLVAPSWTGHATAAIKHFRLAVFSDWLHLLAGGFWVGGLFHLALTWPPALPLLTKPQRTRSLHHVIRLFTRVAMPSVALLVIAGLYNTWAHVPRLEAFWMTPYGKVLFLKLLLVGVMLLLGGLHNFYYGKKAAALEKAEATDPQAHDAAKLERGFSLSVALEAGLGILVLLFTAVLVFTTPARNHPAMEQMNAGASVNQEQK